MREESQTQMKTYPVLNSVPQQNNFKKKKTIYLRCGSTYMKLKKWINKAKQIIPGVKKQDVGTFGKEDGNASWEQLGILAMWSFLSCHGWVWLWDVLGPDQCTEAHIDALPTLPMWSSSEALTWTFQMFFFLPDVTQHGREIGREQEEWIHARRRRRGCSSVR